MLIVHVCVCVYVCSLQDIPRPQETSISVCSVGADGAGKPLRPWQVSHGGGGECVDLFSICCVFLSVLIHLFFSHSSCIIFSQCCHVFSFLLVHFIFSSDTFIIFHNFNLYLTLIFSVAHCTNIFLPLHVVIVYNLNLIHVLIWDDLTGLHTYSSNGKSSIVTVWQRGTLNTRCLLATCFPCAPPLRPCQRGWLFLGSEHPHSFSYYCMRSIEEKKIRGLVCCRKVKCFKSSPLRSSVYMIPLQDRGLFQPYPAVFCHLSVYFCVEWDKPACASNEPSLISMGSSYNLLLLMFIDYWLKENHCTHGRLPRQDSYMHTWALTLMFGCILSHLGWDMRCVAIKDKWLDEFTAWPCVQSTFYRFLS